MAEKLSRRRFLAGSAIAVGLAHGIGRGFAAPVGETGPAWLVNHVGFLPHQAKYLLSPGREIRLATIEEMPAQKQVLRRESTFTPGDLGDYSVLDLSDLRAPGTYRMIADNTRPATLHVRADLYSEALRAGVEYFRQQRCGHPTIGHHAPCHLDDGRRSDNGQHHDASGGWHDACDLRKWVDAVIYGVIGLARAVECLGDAHPDAPRALEEIRWGNAYFLKMQDRRGFIMRWCGGDDGNHYTDNKIGTLDDRVLDTEPCELPGQFLFVAAQACAARLFRKADRGYADRCADAGRRCLEWCGRERSPGICPSFASGVIGAMQMYATTGAPAFAAAAGKYAGGLLKLHVKSSNRPSEPGGYFRFRLESNEPYRDFHHGNLALLALCELLEGLPAHADAPGWRAALRAHCDHLSAMASRSAFGIIPYGLYVDRDPGGDRKIGACRYRWFMMRNGETKVPEYWVGINAHLASNGVGLLRAGKILDDEQLIKLSQRQLDWVLGVNPFDASTMTGIGKNQPRLYRAGAFRPPTPPIAGGVMNGIGGDDRDRPALEQGSWQTCEYWTPMTAYTHWLMAQLQKSAT